MPENQNPTGATQENAPADPAREPVRFAISYANVYVDLATGEIELGARVYKSADRADERRQTHPVRDGLAFVGVFPVAACIAETVRDACIARGRDELARRQQIAREQQEAEVPRAAQAAAGADTPTQTEHVEDGDEPINGGDDADLADG